MSGSCCEEGNDEEDRAVESTSIADEGHEEDMQTATMEATICVKPKYGAS